MKATKKLLIAGGMVLTGIVSVSALSFANARDGFGHQGGHDERGESRKHEMDESRISKEQHAKGGYMKRGMKRGMKLFDKFDVNEDGRVTQDEINKLRLDKLTQYDANKDGKLSLQEYQALWMAHMRARMVDRFQALDDDGDGRVTADEFGKRTSNIVDRLDTNGDKAVTRDEIRNLHSRGRKRESGS